METQTLDTLILLEPADIPNLWPKVEDFLIEANSYGGGKFPIHIWLAKALMGQVDLYVHPELKAAAVCEPIYYPLKGVYCIVLLGGEGSHDWAEYQKQFEQGAIARNCSCLEIYGRPGWRHIVDKMGYEPAHHVWRKELE